MNLESAYHLLSYFQDFLETNKLEHLKYVALEELKERCGSLIDFVDDEAGIIKYWGVFSDQHSNGEPIEALVVYDFYKTQNKLLFLEAQKVTVGIDKLVYTKTGADEFYKPLLKNISQELYYLRLKANKFYPTYDELNNALKLIENYLLNRYGIKPFAQKKVDDKLSYFGFKNTVSRDIFRDLYDLADRLEIIDYDEVEEQTFLEVFLENPSESNKVIKFNCKNDLMKQFIENIRPLFTSLNPKSIEKSGKFLTKRNIIITESNYNRTKLKSSDKLDRLISEMDTILSS